MQNWTQDEAIAFECARECITHMMAICSGELHNNPSDARCAELVAERSRLAGELRTLRLKDHAEIARIRSEYGSLIRAWGEKIQAA
jgi:hypothetical protein